MDAKERHELKDNDLAEFLQNFGEFWDKHGNKISVFILVFVAGWFGIRYYQSNAANRVEMAWSDLESMSTPEGYRERAKENAGIPGLANLALLRGAEAYHQQAIKIGSEAVEPESDLMSAEDSLNNAVKMYKQVLDSKADSVFRANAAVGLANVEETRGDFEAAKTYWTQAQQIGEEARLVSITAQAKLRLEMLDGLASPIIFDESEAAVEEPAGTDAVAPADPG